MNVKKKIRELIELIENTEINDLELTSFWGMQKIKLSKNVIQKEIIEQKKIDNSQHVLIDSKETEQTLSKKETSSEVVSNKELEADDDLITITAPLVGTFYQSSSPESQPFVSLGSKIKKGDILCIIEAMKIFNEIESEHEGEIVSIEIEDSSPVEYSQALFKIKTTTSS